MKKPKATNPSNVGMALTFTQVCVGDTIKLGSHNFSIKGKSEAERYVEVVNMGSSPRRIYEFEFNQSNPILVEEA